MITKKSLENRIRGWLPKELNTSNYRRTSSQKTPKIGIQIGIMTFVIASVGGLLGALGLFSKVGVYISAIAIVVGITIVVATIIISKTKQKETQRSANT